MQTCDLFTYSPEAADPPNESSSEDSEEISGDENGLKGAGSHPRPLKKFTEIKEQMYQDKLTELKRQLNQLKEGSHPDWTKKLRRLEMAHKERQRINTIIRDLEIEMVEQDFINEKKSAVREFEVQKIYLRDQLIAELEEKPRMIEVERHSLELNGDLMELKPISTRKLRRRAANDPTGSSGYGPTDKRRKVTRVSALTYLLDESDVLDDLKIINKSKAVSLPRSAVVPPVSQSSSCDSPSPTFYPRDIRIEDGKLFFEKRWFRRGQAVLLEVRGGEKFAAMISAIGSDAIWVRKTNDSSKLRIDLSQLAKGKYLLKRRAV